MDDDDLVEDDEFLSLVDAVEADIMKRRKMNDGGSYTPPSNSNPNPNPNPNPVGEEGPYLAALRGSNSHLWQTMNNPKTNTNKRPAEIASYGGVGGGGVGVGGVCFKCQQPGHWAKDCVASTYAGPNRGDESGPQAPEKQCPCGGGPCLVLMSSTEKNPGRKFYKCPLREDGGRCNFFEWCDAAQGSSGAYGGQARAFSADISEGSEPSMQCPCGAGLCPVLTAKTERNSGRQFFRCPLKEGEGSCRFFKWCDELNSISNPLPSVAHGFSSNNDNTPSNSGRTRPSLCCYKCGMDGHWAKDCTNSSSGLIGVSGTGQGERSSASNTCFKCGQAGHWAKDCTSQVSNSSYGGREFSNSSFNRRGASRPTSSTYRSR